jgi:hypothetical protein
MLRCVPVIDSPPGTEESEVILHSHNNNFHNYLGELALGLFYLSLTAKDDSTINE